MPIDSEKTSSQDPRAEGIVSKSMRIDAGSSLELGKTDI